MLSILENMKEVLENNNLNDEDKLEKIFELSTPLDRAINKTGDAARPVGIHLAKIIMFGFKEIWCEHIMNNLNNLTIGWDLAIGRYPTKEEFSNWLRKPITTLNKSNFIIRSATREWEKEKTKYEKKIRNITSLEFLNIWNNFVDELSKIFIGDEFFEYKDIEKILKKLNTLI